MFKPFLAATLAVALASSALAAPPTPGERLQALVTSQIAKGEHELVRERRLASPAARLYALDLALGQLRSARTNAANAKGETFDALRRDAEAGVVTALVRQATIHYERGSLRLAGLAVADALAWAPHDPRALNLEVMIRAAEETDVYAKTQGTAAIQRIRDRRAASGLPLRDRGIATRR